MDCCGVIGIKHTNYIDVPLFDYMRSHDFLINLCMPHPGKKLMHDDE